jgi:HAE1 family hydrophobic/amphiphilic exporter-1
VLVINVPYPGASPETVEREVVNRIEKALQGISGIDQCESTSREGSATIVLVFDFDKNMIEAADEVRNAIGSVRYKLPVEIREPIMQRLDPAAQPIMQLALSSQRPEPRADVAPGRGPAGRQVPRHPRRGGGQRQRRAAARAVHAAAAQKLREYGVSVTEVVSAVRAQNATAPGGQGARQLEDQSIRWSAASSRPPSSSRSSSSAAATRWCAWAGGHGATTASPR